MPSTRATVLVAGVTLVLAATWPEVPPLAKPDGVAAADVQAERSTGVITALPSVPHPARPVPEPSAEPEEDYPAFRDYPTHAPDAALAAPGWDGAPPVPADGWYSAPDLGTSGAGRDDSAAAPSRHRGDAELVSDGDRNGAAPNAKGGDPNSAGDRDRGGGDARPGTVGSDDHGEKPPGSSDPEPGTAGEQKDPGEQGPGETDDHPGEPPANEHPGQPPADDERDEDAGQNGDADEDDEEDGPEGPDEGGDLDEAPGESDDDADDADDAALPVLDPDAVTGAWASLRQEPGSEDGGWTSAAALGLWWAVVEDCGDRAPQHREACAAAARDLLAELDFPVPDPHRWLDVDPAARDVGVRTGRHVIDGAITVDDPIPHALPLWATTTGEPTTASGTGEQTTATSEQTTSEERA